MKARSAWPCVMALAMIPALMGQSCTPVTPGDGDEDDAGRSWWDQGSLFECGSQTVSNVPGPGFVEIGFGDYSIDAQPAESALMQVVFPMGALNLDVDYESAMGGTKILYEVNENAAVISQHILMEVNGQKYDTVSAPTFDAWFEVQDGCLRMQMDMGDTGMPEVDWSELDDVPGVGDGPCGEGRIAVDRDGLVIGEPDGDYICVDLDMDYCHDCWFENDTWYEKIEMSGRYEAQGSLDNVSIAGYVGFGDGTGETANINDGDEVSYSMVMTSEYRRSASPEELGYEPYEPYLPPGNSGDSPDDYDDWSDYLDDIDWSEYDWDSYGLPDGAVE